MLTKDSEEGPFIEVIEFGIRFLGIEGDFVSISLPEPLDLLFQGMDIYFKLTSPGASSLTEDDDSGQIP